MKFEGCIQLFMLPWKQQKRHILPVNHNLSSVYFSLAKFQLVSCNLSLATLQLHADLSVYPKFWGYQVFMYSGYCSCHCRLPSEESTSGIPLI